jgi:hypothetical protein
MIVFTIAWSNWHLDHEEVDELFDEILTEDKPEDTTR